MISQPYVYKRHELAEPDWRRFPGWAQVPVADWESAQWQRAHCVKNSRQLRQAIGEGLGDQLREEGPPEQELGVSGAQVIGRLQGLLIAEQLLDRVEAEEGGEQAPDGREV